LRERGSFKVRLVAARRRRGDARQVVAMATASDPFAASAISIPSLVSVFFATWRLTLKAQVSSRGQQVANMTRRVTIKQTHRFSSARRAWTLLTDTSRLGDCGELTLDGGLTTVSVLSSDWCDVELARSREGKDERRKRSDSEAWTRSMSLVRRECCGQKPEAAAVIGLDALDEVEVEGDGGLPNAVYEEVAM